MPSGAGVCERRREGRLGQVGQRGASEGRSSSSGGGGEEGGEGGGGCGEEGGEGGGG